MGEKFRRDMKAWASASGIPVISFKSGDRKAGVMAPFLQAAAEAGRSQVVAVGCAQEFQLVWTARRRDTDPAGCPQFSFTREQRRVSVFYVYIFDQQMGPGFICFEDEAGQGLSPPRGRTWAPRGARPVVKVRGAGGGRVSIAGVACYRPGDRPHLFYQLRVYRRRKGEAKGFTWQDYRDLIIATHHSLSAPLVWCWDNLNIHLAPELADFAVENKAWLRVYRLPAYAPDLNPTEMGLPQCGFRRASSLAWLLGSLSWEVPIEMAPSVQRRRLW
jgi:DDE superfamily endonuclease